LDLVCRLFSFMILCGVVVPFFFRKSIDVSTINYSMFLSTIIVVQDVLCFVFVLFLLLLFSSFKNSCFVLWILRFGAVAF